MDQIKIGEFISNLRKEQELTQKQLAEKIGVSDKTVSKWECGNGMPELSMLPILCEALGINVNELLSGERLAEADYSKRAEENMLHLIRESEEQKKKNTGALLQLAGGLLLVIFTVGFLIFIAGIKHIALLFDIYTFLIMLLTSVAFLIVAGLFRYFFLAFWIAAGKRPEHTQTELLKAGEAVRLAADTLFVTGALITVTGIIPLGISAGESALRPEWILANVSVALLGLFYGIVAYLLLLPLRSRLKALEAGKNAE